MAKRKLEKLNGVRISDIAIQQPVFITMMMLLIITFGILAFRTTPINLLPDFEVPVISVSVAYPGASPESVAQQVAEPIEDAVNTVSGLDHITSTANEGIVTIILEFAQSVDIDQADKDVREKVDAIRPTLPRDAEDPIYQQFDPNQAPIMSIAIGANAGQSPLELRQLIENDIVPQIQRGQGVGSVSVSGGQTRQINVQMDLTKLQAYQILPSQITRSLDQANANLGLGSIETDSRAISLRAPSMLQSTDDIAKIRITGTQYRVGDVAVVQDGVEELDSYSRLNGQEAIILDVRKQSGSNTVAVADEVRAQVEETFAGRTDLNYTIPQDDSEAVRQSVISSLEELIFASLAAFIVVLFFFRNLRSTIITMSGLPVIIIGTFAFMPVFGISINLISLLALSLCVGLVIDDAIVVRENIFRHIERGETPRVASSKGTAEVSLSVLAMTLTIVAVFVPITFTQGTTGVVFGTFGYIIAIAILLSLVEAFTIAPMLSANVFKNLRVGKKKDQSDTADNEPTVLQNIDEEEADAGLVHEANEDPGWLGRTYGRLLALSLRSIWTRLAVIGIAIVVLVLSGTVASGLKFAFFPAQDPGEFYVGYELEPGTTLAETNRLAQQAEQTLVADLDIETVISTVGFSGNSERAQFFVKLKPDVLTPPVQERLRPQLDAFPRLAFSAPTFQGGSTSVTGRELQVSVQTPRSAAEIRPLIDTITAEAQQVPGLVDVDTNYKPGKPELQFLADPARIGDVGLTNDDIATSVRALINGSRATTLRQNGEDTDVVVRLFASDRSDPQDIESIVIPTQSGTVPLSALGSINYSSGPTTVRRYDQINQVIIGANLDGVNINDAQAALQARLDKLDLPSDVIVSYVGDVQQQTDGFGSLFIAMGLSVLFVYMVLASQFGSFTQPFVIMLAMPFSFIGAFLALRLVGVPLDITGMIGLILLLGLVVKNSILLVDFTNRLRAAGMEKHEALRLAGEIRLRPILMTALSLIAGALPVAIGIHVIGTGEGSEFRRGLAVVIIGGMITSTLLTLLVVPTAYSLLEGATSRIGRLFRRGKREEDDAGTPPPAPPRPVPAYAGPAPVGASGSGGGSMMMQGAPAYRPNRADVLRGRDVVGGTGEQPAATMGDARQAEDKADSANDTTPIVPPAAPERSGGSS